ncbi:primase-helicase family protein [Viscerimonas tarda]
MKEGNKDSGLYIRVGTTLYKIVRRPLMSGDFIEERRVWNYETLRQDHSKDFISRIEKYDGFCSVPDHISYQRSIGTFLNQYEPIPYQPAQGNYPLTLEFLRHIFHEQLEMGLDYLQLLYLKPLTKLPIILLVSNERNTGKTTFLNFLKAIFAGNMTFNTNEDFHSQFNSDWANKLIVGVDEALLDRREDSERIKNLSTALSYKAEAKGKDRQEVEFFAKFVLCSNNETCPIIVEKGETRYWVRKIHPLTQTNVNMLDNLKREIPQFLNFLLHRELSTKKESRMWFRHDLLITDALRRIITHNRGKVENEMIHIISDLMQIQQAEEYLFSVNDLFDMVRRTAISTDIHQIRKILQDKWQLQPKPPTYYTACIFGCNGEILSLSGKTARVYCISKKQLDGIMSEC